MNIICKFVGHKPPIYAKPGWYSPGEQYGTLVVGKTDGIGRMHAIVRCECARCGAKFTVARVHLPHNERVIGQWLLDLAGRCRKPHKEGIGIQSAAFIPQVAVSSTTATKSHG